MSKWNWETPMKGSTNALKDMKRHIILLSKVEWLHTENITMKAKEDILYER
jgi:hypothetical protein